MSGSGDGHTTKLLDEMRSVWRLQRYALRCSAMFLTLGTAELALAAGTNTAASAAAVVLPGVAPWRAGSDNISMENDDGTNVLDVVNSPTADVAHALPSSFKIADIPVNASNGVIYFDGATGGILANRYFGDASGTTNIGTNALSPAAITAINANTNGLDSIAARTASVAATSNAIPAKASSTDAVTGTDTNKFVTPGSLAAAGLSNGVISAGAIILGVGASSYALIATNVEVEGVGKPISRFITIDRNTSVIVGTNGPIAGRNVVYWRNNKMNLWTNNNLNITNYPNTSIYTLQLAIGGPTAWSNASGLGGTWFSVPGRTNVPFSTFNPTNGLYAYDGYGFGASNFFTMLPTVTNGNFMRFTSNGVPYTVIGAVGSTNQTITSP